MNQIIWCRHTFLLQINVNDEITINVCQLCADKITELHQFYVMYMETNRKLREIKKIIGKNDNTYCEDNQKMPMPTSSPVNECTVFSIASSIASSSSSSGSTTSDTSDDEHMEDDDKNYEFDRIWECFKCHMIKINLNELQAHFQQCLHNTTVTKQLNNNCDNKLVTSEFPSNNKVNPQLDELKPTECSVCFKQFKTRRQRNGHMQMHSLNRKTKSKHSVTSRQFESKPNVLPSIGRKRGHRTVDVKENGKNASRRLTHENKTSTRAKIGKLKKCDVCGKKFTCEQVLHSHLNQVHMLNKKFECNVCKERFYTITRLIVHQNSHEMNDRNFHCQYCNRKFLSFASMESHVKTIHRDVVNENGNKLK